MKTAYVMLAIFALAVAAAVPVVADTCNTCNNSTYGNEPLCNSGGSCQGGAWRTSPLPNCQCPTMETITETPEWQACGTFCEAGQTPPGWPYGWCDDYWLRPNSNY